MGTVGGGAMRTTRGRDCGNSRGRGYENNKGEGLWEQHGGGYISNSSFPCNPLILMKIQVSLLVL